MILVLQESTHKLTMLHQHFHLRTKRTCKCKTTKLTSKCKDLLSVISLILISSQHFISNLHIEIMTKDMEERSKIYWTGGILMQIKKSLEAQSNHSNKTKWPPSIKKNFWLNSKNKISKVLNRKGSCKDNKMKFHVTLTSNKCKTTWKCKWQTRDNSVDRWDNLKTRLIIVETILLRILFHKSKLGQ